MINRVLDLQSLTVRQAMKPIGDAVTLPAQASVSKALEVCREKHFTRIPVWEEADGRQRVVGLVSCNDLLFKPGLDPQRALAELIRPALYLDEDLRLELAMRRMQKAGQRLAIVLGRERRDRSIVTQRPLGGSTKENCRRGTSSNSRITEPGSSVLGNGISPPGNSMSRVSPDRKLPGEKYLR